MERNKLYTRATVTVGGKEEGGGGGGATICTAQVQPTIVRVNERGEFHQNYVSGGGWGSRESRGW